MKNKLITIIGLAAFVLAGVSQAQPASPGDVLSNIPTVPLATEKIGISIGALMDGGSTFKNAEIVDYTFAKGIFARGELEAASSSSVISSAGIGAGVSHSWDKARLYGFLEGRRNWDIAKWEGIGGVGVAYTPMTNGILAKISTVVEQRIKVTSAHAPPTETFIGLRWSF